MSAEILWYPQLAPLGMNPAALASQVLQLQQMVTLLAIVSKMSKDVGDTVIQQQAELWSAALDIYAIAARSSAANGTLKKKSKKGTAASTTAGSPSSAGATTGNAPGLLPRGGDRAAVGLRREHRDPACGLERKSRLRLNSKSFRRSGWTSPDRRSLPCWPWIDGTQCEVIRALETPDAKRQISHEGINLLWIHRKCRIGVHWSRR